MKPNWAIHGAFMADRQRLPPLPSKKRDVVLERKSIPIQHRGETLYRLLNFDVRDCKGLTVVFEGHEGPWRQGLHIEVDKGKLDVFEVTHPRMHLWIDTAPPEVPVRFVGKPRLCRIWNVWDPRPGILGLTNCAAIRLERLPDGMRLHCNDGYPDEDFTDLVVRLRFLPEDGGVPPLVIPQVAPQPGGEGKSNPPG